MKVTENKPHSVHLRLTDDQYAFLKGDADAMGIGVSDYLRIIVNMTMVSVKKASEQINAKMEQVSMQLGDLGHEDKKNNI